MKPHAYRTYFWLLLLTLLTSVAILPAAALLKIPLTPPLAALAVAFPVALTALTAGAGLPALKALKSGPPDLLGWLRGAAGGWQMVALALPVAILAGLVIGVLQTAVAYAILHLLNLRLTPTPFWLAIIGAVSGALREEIWYRLGLMTVFIWIGTRLRKRESPRPGIVWTANILAALCFGAQHFSSDFTLLSGQANAAVLGAIILLYHAAAGVVFGWVYWRRGLVAAMTTHFCADMAIAILNALVGVP